MWRIFGKYSIIMLIPGAMMMVWGCGQQDPDIAIPGDSGSLSVVSVPDSAQVMVDGLDTGFLTPIVLPNLSIGMHTVRVAKSGYTSRPESLIVEILSGETTTATFELDAALPRPLLLESFTNVSCGPCAEANPMMYGLMEELGSDQAVLLEFHTYFPSPLDPYYLNERAIMDAWILRYGITQAPWLVVEGVEGLQPATEEGIREVLDTVDSAEDVRFSLSGIRTSTSLSCSLGVSAAGDPGTYDVIVLVTEDSREFEEPPGSNGETLFKHVVRGAMPDADGEEVELVSDTEVWFNWQIELSWLESSGPIRLHALARTSGDQRVVGLKILDIP